MTELTQKFPTVFSPRLGTMKHMKAYLSIKLDTQPQFYHPRTVPYPLKDAINIKLGTFCRVNHAEWATPIVVSVAFKLILWRL